MSDDIIFMKAAIEQAKAAMAYGEVPVGAVITRGREIIAAAFNTRETNKNALCHAEIKAIDQACKRLSGWRLPDCTLYVTLEPCPMCAGAIVNARIERVVFGAYDYKAGAFGSLLNLNAFSLNHKPEILGGVLAEECGSMLTEFFRERRNK